MLEARGPGQLSKSAQLDEGNSADMLSHGIIWVMAEAVLAAAEQAACVPAKRKKYTAEAVTGAY